jgi:septum formation protein
MLKMHNFRYLLSSSSPRRRELLKQIGLRFRVKKISFEEIMTESFSRKTILKLAVDKARVSVAYARKNEVIISADTVVVLGKRVFGKPRDKKDAFLMLKELSGKTHIVFTAFAVIHNRAEYKDIEETKVTFKKLSDNEIKSYIDTDEPMDKAGAYAVQGMGALFIKRIDGDYFNVVGLPLFRLGQIINSF